MREIQYVRGKYEGVRRAVASAAVTYLREVRFLWTTWKWDRERVAVP